MSLMRPHSCSVELPPCSLDHLPMQRSRRMKALQHSWIRILTKTPNDVPISQLAKLRPRDTKHFAHSCKHRKGKV